MTLEESYYTSKQARKRKKRISFAHAAPVGEKDTVLQTYFFKRPPETLADRCYHAMRKGKAAVNAYDRVVYAGHMHPFKIQNHRQRLEIVCSGDSVGSATNSSMQYPMHIARHRHFPVYQTHRADAGNFRQGAGQEVSASLRCAQTSGDVRLQPFERGTADIHIAQRIHRATLIQRTRVRSQTPEHYKAEHLGNPRAEDTAGAFLLQVNRDTSKHRIPLVAATRA
ncbi:hypothetical protein FB645_003000 [Coemansia sp. IMI 203386]|nr:hypothetical protein FB645_003000 [Coemansia sp. IMI 203386]